MALKSTFQNAFIHNGFENLVSIDYGDGKSGTSASHVYDTPGTYTVTMYFSQPLQEIPAWAFVNTSISGIVIPASVTKLGESSLSTSVLKSVTFEQGSKLAMIDNSAFSLSAITAINLPSSVESIGDCVFGGCTNLEQVTVGANNKFGNHSGVVFCEKVENYFDIICVPTASSLEVFQAAGTHYNLRSGAIADCKNLKRIECAIKEIEHTNLVNCSELQYVNLEQVELIGSNCLCNNGALKEINFGSNKLKELVGIGSQNNSLEKVTIPSGVTKISSSFNGCSSLTYIYCSAVEPPTLESSFDEIPANAVIYVPADSFNKYSTAAGWSAFASKLQALQLQGD